MQKLTVAALLMLASLTAAALDVVVDGDRLILSGPISLSDSVTYREATRDAKFGTVILVNSPGGSIDVAFEIAEDVAARGADTVVAGFCQSACTFIFVAGRNRTMSDAWPAGLTRLGVHGTYDRVTGMASRDRARVFAHYRRYIGDRFDAGVFDRAINVDAREEFVHFYHPVYFKGSVTQICDGSPNPGSVACKPLPGKDAYGVGLLTSLQLTPLKLPSKYEYQDLVLGFPIAKAAPVSTEQLAAACKGVPACLQSLQRYATRAGEKAWAVTASGKTGVAYGGSEKWPAARRASSIRARSSTCCCRSRGRPSCSTRIAASAACPARSASWARGSRTTTKQRTRI
jgi:hypothetical protein